MDQKSVSGSIPVNQGPIRDDLLITIARLELVHILLHSQMDLCPQRARPTPRQAFHRPLIISGPKNSKLTSTSIGLRNWPYLEYTRIEEVSDNIAYSTWLQYALFSSHPHMNTRLNERIYYDPIFGRDTSCCPRVRVFAFLIE